MKRFGFKSLAMRIWTIFTAVILVIICSISLLYLFAFRRIDENNKIHDLKVAHDILLKSSSFNEPNRLDELRNLRGIDHFIVKIDDNNKIQITNFNRRQEMPPLEGKDAIPPERRNPLQSRINSQEVRIWMTGYIKESNIYEQQFKENYNNIKFLFIISSVQGNSREKSYLITYMPYIEDNILLYIVLITGIIFIFIGFLTSRIVAKAISKPLKELEKHTIKIARKDWKEPIKVKSQDEIGRLAEAMNRMQRELKRADEEEKMFLQSISHDLKTPVMVIMSHAEAILDGVYIESLENTAQIIKEEASGLEKKIKQLLYLNTLDYVLDKENEEGEIDLHRFLLRIINRFELLNSSIEWELDLEDVIIVGNEDKLKVAIDNILDNGLRYAESKIAVSLKRKGLFAFIEIYNDGPDIPEKYIDYIFDHLYKDKTGNFGLGLAISKKIINFYKGEIEAVNRDKGVSFIIKYPL